MASVGARAYNGGLGAEPPAGSRGRVPGQVVRGRSPPEDEKLPSFLTPKENQNLAIFQGFLGSFLSDPVEVTDPFSIIYPDIEASGATIHHQNG